VKLFADFLGIASQLFPKFADAVVERFALHREFTGGTGFIHFQVDPDDFETLLELPPDVFQFRASCRVAVRLQQFDGLLGGMNGLENAIPPSIEGFQAFDGEGIGEDESVQGEVERAQFSLDRLDVGHAGGRHGVQASDGVGARLASGVERFAEFPEGFYAALFEKIQTSDDVCLDRSFEVQRSQRWELPC